MTLNKRKMMALLLALALPTGTAYGAKQGTLLNLGDIALSTSVDPPEKCPRWPVYPKPKQPKPRPPQPWEAAFKAKGIPQISSISIIKQGAVK